MIKRSINRNLTIHKDPTYMDLPVNRKQTLAKQYLQRLYHVMSCSVEQWERVMLFHATLKFPARGVDDPAVDRDTCISDFIASFKSKVQAKYDKNIREGKTAYEPKVRYAWARERETSLNDHYHVFIFLNGDAYRGLGHFNSPKGNTATRVIEAWCDTIGVDHQAFRRLVHFTDVKYLETKNKKYSEQRKEAFHWMSYLAKLETKPYGSKTNYFGCSRD